MNIDWVNQSVFYHIYPLGFCDSPRYNEGETTAESRILKINEWIPHLKDLGINAVYFGPIFQSVSHGYDTSNYYETDSRLGTFKDFQDVFENLHSNGIKIILDGVFNHVGRGFWAFNDVQNKLTDSEYKDWFSNLDFSKKSPAGDNFSYEMWEGNAELVKLNLKNEAVCQHLINAVKMWIEKLGIDGLRLDAADCVDKDFFKRLYKETCTMKEDFWLMGEIIHGDYRDWANDEMLHSVTNYECWKGIYSSHNDKNYFEIAYSLDREFGPQGIYKHLCLYNFLDNHDVNRIASLLKDKKDLENAYTLLFTMPGVPSVYYGSEWGIEGTKGQGMLADEPIRPSLNLGDFDSNSPLLCHIKNLIQKRKSSKALCYGTYEKIFVKNEQLAFARCYEEETVVIVMNLSDRQENISFQYAGRQYDISLHGKSSYIIGI